jgi:hypothetical protein
MASSADSIGSDCRAKSERPPLSSSARFDFIAHHSDDFGARTDKFILQSSQIFAKVSDSARNPNPDVWRQRWEFPRADNCRIFR